MGATFKKGCCVLTSVERDESVAGHRTRGKQTSRNRRWTRLPNTRNLRALRKRLSRRPPEDSEHRHLKKNNSIIFSILF
jgi:hypothetical protein